MKINKVFRNIISVLLIVFIFFETVVNDTQSVQASSGTWTGGTVDKGFHLKVEWTESNLNAINNTSTVTATVYLVQDPYYSLYIGSNRTVTIKIGSNSTSLKYANGISNKGGVTTKLGSFSTTVTHSSSGSCTVPISASFAMNATLSGTYFGTMTTSNNAVLTTLNRTVPTVKTSITKVGVTFISIEAKANTTCDQWYYSKDNGKTWTSFGKAGVSNKVDITGLSANTTYKILTKARNSTNHIVGTSAIISQITKPTYPTGVVATATSATSGTLKWNAVSGTKTYNVYKDEKLIATGITSTSYNFTGLSSGTTYTLGVCAGNDAGASAITRTNLTTLPADSPTNVKISSVTSTSGTLSWNAVTGAKNYNVYKDGTLVASGITATSYSFTGLTSGTTYKLGVSAVNDGGSTTISTINFTPPPVSAPTGLSIKSVSATSGTLNWTAVSGAASYNIYRNGTLVASNVTGTSYTFSGLASGTSYSVSVSAVNAGGTTATTATTFTTLPGKATDLKASNLSDTSATLSWTAVTGATSYNIYNGNTLLAKNVTSTSYFINNLTPGTNYTFNVAAVNAGGTGELSPLSVLTLPGRTEKVIADSVTQSTISLSWNKVNGSDTYNVYLNSVLFKSGITDTSYKVDNLLRGTNYTISVRAVNKSGEGATTAESISTLEAADTPTNLIITDQSTTSVSLEWNENTEKSVDHYIIYRDGLKIGEGKETRYTDKLYKNTASQYTVTAVDYDGLETGSSEGIETADITAPVSSAVESENSILESTITTTFEDDNSGIDTSSFKWAYGKQDVSYFKLEGNSYDGSKFTVTRNGTYTIYSVDIDGNAGVSLIDIEDIYFTETAGNFTQSYNDLSIDAPGLKIDFSRYYDSANTSDGPFGLGWSFSYSGKIEELSTPENVILVELPGGAKEYFTISGDNYTGINTRDTLTKDSNGYNLTSGLLKYSFNSNGILTCITDQNGNSINISLNADGYPVQITDSVQRKYNISYTDNRISSITDPVGRSIKYSYDNGKLTSVYSQSGALINQNTYDSNGLLQNISDSYGNAIYTIKYDSYNRITSLINEGIETDYTYSDDVSGNQIIDNGSEKVVYDNFGNIVIDSDGTVTTYLNLYGDINKKVMSDGSYTEYTYDQYGNISTQISYDESGLVIEKIIYSYTYYTGTDKIKEYVESNTSTNYDEDGKASSKTSVITKTYDTIGNMLTEQQKDSDTDTTVAYTYQANGLVATSTDKKGTVTTYTYDKNGYVSHATVEDIDKNTTNIDYSYNTIGQLLEQHVNGLSYNYAYDSMGNVVKQTVTDCNTQVRTTRYDYDDKGNLIQKISPAEYNSADDGLTVDANGISQTNTYKDKTIGVRYSYDTKNGELIKTEVGKYSIDSDKDGNVTGVQVAGNNLASYVYTGDKNDLLKSVAYANGATISYVYSDNGKPTQMSVNGSVAYTYTYDKDGILVSKNDIKENTVTTYLVNEDGSTTVTVKNSDTSAVTDCYTISKDSLQFTDTVGTHTYGKTGNSDETLDDFSYDSKSIYNKSYTVNSEDKVTSEEVADSEGNILSTSYTYDAAGNITLITNTTESGTEETAYTYDSFGNITTITINGVLSYHYYYDISDQLIRVDDAVQNETISYIYDDNGNILSVNTYDYTTDSIDKLTPSDTIVYKYDNGNFPDELTSYDGKNITYDELGNPLSYLGWNMTWEAGRRLSKINNGTDEISYKYDDNGIRTSKTVNGVTTTYTSIDGRITSQDDGTNTIYYRYDKDDELTGFNLNGTEYVYVKNAQGDITGILDTDGNQVVCYTYNAWGKIESITGAMADTVGQINPMRYRGYYQDEETGFYYLQSRYYDPVVERFINADEPALLNVLASSVAGANLFAYCGNNAVNNSDGNGCWSLRSLIKKAVKKVYNTAVYVTSYVPRKMWMLVVNNYLKPKKWYLSAELLAHSLQNNPSDLTYKSGSSMVKAIQNSTIFKNKINSIIKNAKNNSLFYKCTIQFTSGDLLGSLHICSLQVGGNKKNGRWYLNINMYDYYDFARDFSYYGGSLVSFCITIGNNMAWVDQSFGVIQGYSIFIKFSMVR